MRPSTVAVVYHFFAHYREPIIRELLAGNKYRYVFAGDSRDPLNSGIREARIPDPAHFIHTRCHFIRGRYLIQSGVIRLALRRDITAMIFLGDAQFLTTWLSAALARLMGKRVLYWSQGWPREEGGFKGWVRCTFYHLAHGLMLYGNRAKALGVQQGFRPGDLYVIYNSLGYDRQCALRSQYSLESIVKIRTSLFAQPHNPMVICTSRLVRLRRLDLLLEAMTLLRRQGHEINLLLVGEGPERRALEKYALDNQLWVRFYGECYDEAKLAELFAAANLTVAPGKVGLTAVHSLVYGTPVVTHDDPDDQMPEWEAISPGITGDFFRRGDSSDLARVIRKWTLTEYPNEELRPRCYDVIDRFYNPAFQRSVIEQALAGVAASDTRWTKWRKQVADL